MKGSKLPSDGPQSRANVKMPGAQTRGTGDPLYGDIVSTAVTRPKTGQKPSRKTSVRGKRAKGF